MGVNKAKDELVRIQREIARLQEGLNQAKALETKITHYIEMAQRFEGNPENDVDMDVSRESGSSRTNRIKLPSSGTSLEAVQATIEILREQRRPIRTRDLLPMLKEKGITIGGANPVTNLSGFLSRSPDLVANRSLGWHLADWNDSHVDNVEAADQEQDRWINKL